MTAQLYPFAAGTADFGPGNMLPTLFSTKVIRFLYPQMNLQYITNTDQVAELTKYGQKITFRVLPGLNIFNHVSGQKLVTDTLIPASLDINADKGKYWNFAIDDVQRFQSDIPYAERWAAHAAKELKIAIETDFLSSIYAECNSTNQGVAAGAISGGYNLGAVTVPVVATESNVVRYLTHCQAALSENNVEEDENSRYQVIPVWMAALLKGSDLKAAFLTGDDKSIIRSSVSYIGNIAGARTFVSNLLPVATESSHTSTYILFGHKDAIGFVTQITEKDILRDQQSFATLMRALNVYGFGALQPTAFGCGYVTPV